MAFGQELRRLRVERGWSQDEVAKRMAAYGYDWHQTTIGRIETARRPLGLNEAGALAALFGYTLESLLLRQYGEPGKPSPSIEEVEEELRAQVDDFEVAERVAAELHRRLDKALAEVDHLRRMTLKAETTLEAARGKVGALQEMRRQMGGAQ